MFDAAHGVTHPGRLFLTLLLVMQQSLSMTAFSWAVWQLVALMRWCLNSTAEAILTSCGAMRRWVWIPCLKSIRKQKMLWLGPQFSSFSWSLLVHKPYTQSALLLKVFLFMCNFKVSFFTPFTLNYTHSGKFSVTQLPPHLFCLLCTWLLDWQHDEGKNRFMVLRKTMLWAFFCLKS